MSDVAPRRDHSQVMREALVEIKRLRAKVDELERARAEPIAIIGMGCRLPGGVDGPDAYWRLLLDGVDAIGEVPADRWDAAAYFDPDPDAPGRIVTRAGGFLDRIDTFDPAFFGMSPREARSLDPQQRLLLEVAWEALEHAGQSPAALYGSPAGVFIGMSTFDYALQQVGGIPDAAALERIDGYVATGSTLSPAAGRLSYVLGLTGPSMVVDTACSSSLVAIHLAMASLRARECDLVLAGGVNVVLRPEWNVNFSRAHMLAPDGRCKTFDASADGYSRGEGCGVVVLQRLTDARAMGRRIIAVLRGSAVNQDGASGGLTVPNGPAQEQVIRRALSAAGLRAADVGYVEAHGTGTPLGDPIEVAALGAVFSDGHSKQRPLRIGSVKTNLGHLEAAAGVAGLIKVALTLQHGQIPPHLHVKTRNPLIDWEQLPIEIPLAPTPWESADEPRRAGISSFGFTGTNAHVLLEEAPADGAPVEGPGEAPAEAATDAEAVHAAGRSSSRPLHVLTMSARSPDALRQVEERYVRVLSQSGLDLGDVAWTANAGRTHFRHRLAVVADSASAARTAVQALLAGQAPGSVSVGEARDAAGVAFLFTGQGAQYPGMGRQLYADEPVFRATLDRCDAILRPQLGCPLLEVMYPHVEGDARLHQTAYTQPALFALEYALASLWQAWGVRPTAVMGHSVGEYVAACVAGVFSLEDALALVAARGRLMTDLCATGAMVAVRAAEADVAPLLERHAAHVALAAVNGPASVVLAGSSDAMDALVGELNALGISSQPLRVSHAFHSPLMEPMLEAFARVAERVTFTRPSVTLLSNLTGQVAREELTDPGYWVRHVRQPVRFADGIARLIEQNPGVMLEVGPGTTLLAMGRQCVPEADVAWLPSLREGQDWPCMAHALAEMYVRGVPVDWHRVEGARRRRVVALPTYPFQRQRYWVDQPTRTGRPPSSASEGAGRAVGSTEGRSAMPMPRPGRLGLARRSASVPGGAKAGEASLPAPQNRAHPVDALLYRIEWLEQQGSEPGGRVADGHWVVLEDERGRGAELASRLRTRGAACTLVPAWRHLYDRGGAPASEETHGVQLAQLLADAHATAPVRGIVSFWGLDALQADVAKAPAWTEGLERAVSLMRTLSTASTGPTSNAGPTLPAPRVWFVTQGAARVLPDDRPDIAQALMCGFGRTMAGELPEYWGGLVDLPPMEQDPGDIEALADWLLSRAAEDQVAIRRRGHYVPRVVPLEPSSMSTARPLDPGGTYLITGGLGALGQRVAHWLVSQGVRTLVLASRRGAETPGAEQAIAELRAAGARRVTVVHADVARAGDVDRLLAGIAQSDAPLRGVVHAAGIDAPAAMSELTADAVQHTLGPKVVGAWLLHAKTRGLDLQLFWLWSSVSAVWGAPRRAHYAAANASLDALACLRHAEGLPALSIGWGPWRDGGMMTESDLSTLERAGTRGLDPVVCARALDRLSGASLPHVLVADVDWVRFRAVMDDRGAGRLLSALSHQPPAPADVRCAQGEWVAQLAGLPARNRVPALIDLLRVEVAQTLGFDNPADVPVDQSVFTLGLDSLRAVELAVRLQACLGLDRPRQFFDCPELRTLAVRLLQEMGLEGLPTIPDVAAEPAARESALPSVTLFAEGQEEAVLTFARRAWPRRPVEHLETRWRWMFIDSARRVGVEPRVWLVEDRGAIVGHHGAMPVQLDVAGAELESAWFADTMVLPSHRATAAGASLVIESNDTFAVGLSLGQSDQMRAIALRAGWVQVAPLQVYTLMLRPGRVLRDKVHPLAAGAVSAGLQARHYFRRRMAGAGGQSLDVRLVDRFDDRHDRLWASVRHNYACAVRRDASYLNWKYVDQPGPHFVRLEFLRDGAVVAVAALAIDEPGAIFHYRRALLVDLVVPASDAALVFDVLEGIRRHVAALDVDAIVLFLINPQLQSLVETYGYLRRSPSRHLLVRPLRTTPQQREILIRPESWLVTMGDSDIDRPWAVDGDRIQPRTSLRPAQLTTSVV